MDQVPLANMGPSFWLVTVPISGQVVMRVAAHDKASALAAAKKGDWDLSDPEITKYWGSAQAERQDPGFLNSDECVPQHDTIPAPQPGQKPVRRAPRRTRALPETE